MKSKLYIVILFLATISTFAQQAINYKALIKDNLGNVVANQSVTIQFTILEGAAATSVYQEDHTVNTDVNGIAIVNIGAGNILNGDYNTIDWGSDDHFLNVQIDSGSGLVDLGTTQFFAVPYALYAETSGSGGSGTAPTGLEALNEGNGLGWRLIGKNPNSFGNIGQNAVDLSDNFGASDTRGATGYRSFASGYGTTASGDNATALGYSTEANQIYATATGRETLASGSTATAMGYLSTASGSNSTAMGNNTEASGENATAIGHLSIASAYNSFAAGTQSVASSSYSTAIGYEAVANGQNAVAIGRLVTSSGNASVAMGTNTTASGAESFAMGNNNTATGGRSVALGYQNSVTNDYSFAMGNSVNVSGFSSGAVGYFLNNDEPSSFLVGKFNDNTTDTNALFMVGNGGNATSRSNAFMVLSNGKILAPSLDLAEITESKSLITKEYLEGNYIGVGSPNAPSGLEAFNEGNGVGWRLIGRNPDNYGNIGLNSVDLSYSFGASTENGAIGNFSYALGQNIIADDLSSTVVGMYNDNTSSTSTVFQVGNGNGINRSNAFVVDINGVVTAPSFQMFEIIDDKALITKEYLENHSSTGLEAIDEGNGIGWRLSGSDPTNYGNIGENAVDLSSSNGDDGVFGAKGQNSFASGTRTEASGDASIAMGWESRASGYYSRALGFFSYASGYNSTAIGTSQASGDHSSAIGNSQASGYGSTSLGSSEASGSGSTAMGSSQASGIGSTAMGRGTLADDDDSTVLGKYNDNTTSTTTLFQVGNGISTSSRSNGLTMLQNGFTSVGTHTAPPTADFQVNHGGTNANGFKLQNTSSNNNWWRFYTVNSNGLLYLYSKAGGDSSPVGSFNDDSGLYSSLSDRRVKDNFKELHFNWQDFMQLKPLTYHYKTDNNKQSNIGFVAQDVESIYPELVNYNKEDDLYQLNYSGFGVVAIKAIQEQQIIIENQQKQIDELKGLVQLLIENQ
jgi:hypothetical protein